MRLDPRLFAAYFFLFRFRFLRVALHLHLCVHIYYRCIGCNEVYNLTDHISFFLMCHIKCLFRFIPTKRQKPQ